MSSVRKGIYNYNIIKTASSYNLDKYYGGLILFSPPFSIFSFFLIPLFYCIKDKNKIIMINNWFYKIFYSLFLFFLSVIFISINLVLVPFAYLKTSVQKVSLCIRGIIKFKNALWYIAFGLFMLFAAQLTDCWAFIKSSF